MGRKHRGGGKKKLSRRRRDAPGPGSALENDDDDGVEGTTATSTNFVPSAGRGCHLAHTLTEPWLLGYETFDPSEYGPGFDPSSVPDVALDPDERTVSVTNVFGTERRVCYVTVYDAVVSRTRRNRVGTGHVHHRQGQRWRRQGAGVRDIFVLVPPKTFVHHCHLDVDEITKVEIDSDVQPWSRHPDPDDRHPFLLGVPLGRTSETIEDGGDGDASGESPPLFLCAQGVGGRLTHFFSGNLHSVDFRCDEGTPVLAAADGTVLEVRQDHTLTGVAVRNLFRWNSVLMECDVEECGPNDGNDACRGGPLYVEYVHIQANSAMVRPGDRVQRGQILCLSGTVGFSPEPHLHFAAYRSRDETAPTVLVQFSPRSGGGEGKPSFLGPVGPTIATEK